MDDRQKDYREAIDHILDAFQMGSKPAVIIVARSNQQEMRERRTRLAPELSGSGG